MTRTKQILFSAAAALVALGAAQAMPSPAEAGGKHVKLGFPKHHFHGPRLVITHGHGYGCGWLWRKYLFTGNPYWKFKYYECLY